MSAVNDVRPLIAHVVYRFDVGGLENGVVNLINRIPATRYRHAVIALTEVTDFRRRIERDDVQFISLHKSAGHGIKLAPRLYRIFRDLRPAIVHTRNLAALEATLPAWLARVPVRLHGEHGWDVSDLTGSNRKNRLLRRLFRPFVSHYIALSSDIERYLTRQVGIRGEQITHILNGVDTERFAPPVTAPDIDGCPFERSACWLIGTVGRMQPVKDQITLARAFALARALDVEAARQMRLIIVGDGPERQRVARFVQESGLEQYAWLPGARDDIAAILRGLNCFVLPSLAEGISNTILEAMATGLPVIATRVGGNPELIDDGMTGCLVEASDVEALAQALLTLWRDPAAARRLGRAARITAERRFSLERMATDYIRTYDGLLQCGQTSTHDLRAARPSS